MSVSSHRVYRTDSLRKQTRAQSVVTDSYMFACQRIRRLKTKSLSHIRVIQPDIISRAHSSHFGKKIHLFYSSEKSISQRTVYIWSLTFHSLRKLRPPRIHICLQHLPNRTQLLRAFFHRRLLKPLQKSIQRASSKVRNGCLYRDV
jgi:hypothetical protein